MGSGSWSASNFASYSTTRGRTLSSDGVVTTDYASAQQMFTSRGIDEALNPLNVMRECCDSNEHPETKPVILALDVTGSMGDSAMEIAKKLNVIMTKLLGDIKDIEFMIMGIGDLAYDRAPIQISQFESDTRIAEQLDKIYFEGGGGGNEYESYTAAWYMGSRHTKLDCLNRGKKGIIITIGDETLNPYLPNDRSSGLGSVTGDDLQSSVETKDLYSEVTKKFNVYHLHVEHGYGSTLRTNSVKSTFTAVIGKDNFKVTNIDGITDDIVEIIKSDIDSQYNGSESVSSTDPGVISW